MKQIDAVELVKEERKDEKVEPTTELKVKALRVSVRTSVRGGTARFTGINN